MISRIGWLFFFITLTFWECSATTNTTIQGRDPKTLGLFTIVTFPNDVCIINSDNTLTGTCLSSSECSDRSGTADGNCASGFGVCCLVRVTSCATAGVNVNSNCSYIQNPGFPNAFTNASTTCLYTISRIQDNICQLRYDFAAASLDNPAEGNCADTIRFGSPTSTTVPALPDLCGVLTGQHAYVETGSTGDAGTLTYISGAGTTDRTYNIKVTYIPCNTNYLAPTDCLQYFTGNIGTVMSFNFAGGNFLQNQRYRVCIRQEEGFCGVNYNQSTNMTPDSFELLGGNNAVVGTNCAQNSVTFTGTPLNARQCGQILCGIAAQTNPCTIIANGSPQGFQVTSVNANTGTATGFNIVYTQTPCN